MVSVKEYVARRKSTKGRKRSPRSVAGRPRELETLSASLKKRPLGSNWKFKDLVSEIDEDLSMYNAMLPWRTKRQLKDSRARSDHRRVQETRDKIFCIMQDAAQQIDELYHADIMEPIDRQIEYTVGRPASSHWYRRGDLFSMCLILLQSSRMLTRCAALDAWLVHRILFSYYVEDPEDYARYVLEIFTDRIKNDKHQTGCDDDEDLLHKLDTMIEPFRWCEHEEAQWHVVCLHMSLIEVVIPQNKLLDQDAARTVSIKSRDAICAILEAEPDYWWFGCASLRRQLWRTYCEMSSKCKKYPYEKKCWHTDQYSLLAKLNEWAREELKSKVYEAVQLRLPVELADHILHFALLVEEIPANMKPLPEHLTKHRSMAWRLPEEYKCQHMRLYDDGYYSSSSDI